MSEMAGMAGMKRLGYASTMGSLLLTAGLHAQTGELDQYQAPSVPCDYANSSASELKACAWQKYVSGATEVPARDLPIYRLSLDGPQGQAFISLTDNYPFKSLFDNEPSPDGELQKMTSAYFELEQRYRRKLLTQLGISEADQVFVYNYYKNVSEAFAVSGLKVIAHLNVYESLDRCPCPLDSYQIGFEISRKSASALDGGLVYVGKADPFVHGELKPIVWRKVGLANVPAIGDSQDSAPRSNPRPTALVYRFKWKDLEYFIQDINNEARHLWILQRKRLIYDKTQHNSEGTELTPLAMSRKNRHQWTGRLFKNGPPVFFGFYSVTFGCPTIDFIEPSHSYVHIKCDNRH
jgi:hypothetical protein